MSSKLSEHLTLEALPSAENRARVLYNRKREKKNMKEGKQRKEKRLGREAVSPLFFHVGGR